ncbi:E3 ubiquitin-protein ligase TRIM21-like [Eucyclogobius newberryi]|uniref:E3 ubiquitin-protein ligase TRIM21-like n=1 Tax=Eucyclogobius newberryi TaxID=166745 RepID=UPI003B5A4E7A
MSSTSERSSEETFRCSICLEVFSEPLSTPCGHNICKRCICENTCPLCNRSFDRRPEKHLSEDFILFKAELKKKQQFVADVTLDPNTAAPWLVLSEDLKQVHHTNVKMTLPDSPLRFDTCACVLGKQSFSSGRFYFEVQVKGKTEWDLGVAQESINRKGLITLTPKNGVWCIVLRNKDQYSACTESLVPLSLQRAPQKVGVFVDYGEGLVSFYDADSADLLFSFSGCCFREKLFPFFCPGFNHSGSNSAPLVLTAVEIV